MLFQRYCRPSWFHGCRGTAGRRGRRTRPYSFISVDQSRFFLCDVLECTVIDHESSSKVCNAIYFWIVESIHTIEKWKNTHHENQIHAKYTLTKKWVTGPFWIDFLDVFEISLALLCFYLLRRIFQLNLYDV